MSQWLKNLMLIISATLLTQAYLLLSLFINESSWQDLFSFTAYFLAIIVVLQGNLNEAAHMISVVSGEYADFLKVIFVISMTSGIVAIFTTTKRNIMNFFIVMISSFVLSIVTPGFIGFLLAFAWLAIFSITCGSSCSL